MVIGKNKFIYELLYLMEDLPVDFVSSIESLNTLSAIKPLVTISGISTTLLPLVGTNKASYLSIHVISEGFAKVVIV